LWTDISQEGRFHESKPLLDHALDRPTSLTDVADDLLASTSATRSDGRARDMSHFCAIDRDLHRLPQRSSYQACQGFEDRAKREYLPESLHEASRRRWSCLDVDAPERSRSGCQFVSCHENVRMLFSVYVCYLGSPTLA